MQEILDAPDSIPKSVLDKAECVVILPSVLKLSFGLGSSYGRGVMTCRSGKSFHGSWSAPAQPCRPSKTLAQDCSSVAIPQALFFSS
ncbi:MAG: hypothetical protein WBW14_26515 [Candidatus Acidiferrum sp.]